MPRGGKSSSKVHFAAPTSSMHQILTAQDPDKNQSFMNRLIAVHVLARTLHKYTAHEMETKIDSHGFSEKTTSPFFHKLVNAMRATKESAKNAKAFTA